ncbi:hypothetical protein Hte_003055 [Hypoxylon texense]
MAVLEDVPGFKVVVVVAGEKATEYDDPNDADRERPAWPTSSKYIECIDDAEFSVKAYITGDYAWGYRNHELRMDVTADGHQVSSKLRTRYDDPRVHFKGRETYCNRTQQWVRQKCKFSAISTVDDAKEERVKSDIKIAKDLGLIEVKIWRCIRVGPSAYQSSSPQPHVERNNKLELAEKSLKGRATSHGTSFSSAQETIKPLRYCTANTLDEDGGPIAEFRFNYRSRDALKREMVIPRSPSPDSEPLARMSRAELERLARERLNQLQGGNVKEERKSVIKRELNEIIDLADENARPSKIARKGQVIDLTEDTDEE